jgi:NTP pyrophosphatase (non-canonical NTP hydrolase)
MSQEIEAIQIQLREFARARDWEQFHSPKNLASALSVEAAELLEIFQWLTEEQSRNLPTDKTARVAEELADVMLYTLQLADKLGIDPLKAARDKLRVNESKYPVDLAKGRSDKYTEL